MQVRTLQPAEIADRVRHRSRSARSAVVGCGVSLVSHFLEGSGGRRVLLGRQHSAPRDELAGTWKQRGPQSTRASGCGGHARWRCGGARSGNVGSSGSRVHMGPRHFKQSESAPEQEGTVSSTTKRGEERSRNSAGKETKRQGRRQGRKEQSTPPCRPSRDAIVSQLEFWWWDVWRARGRKLVPGGQSSQMYDVPVRQAPGKTVSTVLTRQGEGRDQDSRAGVQSRWRNFTAGDELLTFLHYFSGPAKFGLGEAILKAAALRGVKVKIIKRDIRLDGIDLLADEPFTTDLLAASDGRFDFSVVHNSSKRKRKLCSPCDRQLWYAPSSLGRRSGDCEALRHSRIQRIQV